MNGTLNIVRYATVIPARNEEEFLPTVLEALQLQTLKPTQTILVDDGSEDFTGDIGRDYGCTVVSLPPHKESWRGMPLLAGVVNAGLCQVRDNLEYVMILGADHVLPPRYVEALIERMNLNPRLVVVSGLITGETPDPGTPRGSGRIVRISFWRPLGLRYPHLYGWEDWLILKAQQLGYETKRFDDVESSILRPTAANLYYGIGRSMQVLGYFPLYALARCVRMFPRQPKAALQMFRGWATNWGVKKADLADWNREHLKKRLVDVVREFEQWVVR